MKKEEIENNLANCECYDNEDLSVFDFFDSLDKEHKYKLLEVGSGVCRFVDKVNKKYSNIDITCFEINSELSKIAKEKGFKIIDEDLLKNTLRSEEYDIVHCSHVIEHFKYPEIIFVIDELLRVTRRGGCCIIRTPLMWDEFYSDIDHIRIYPPSAIINYFTNIQQQKRGDNEIRIISIWYRTFAKKYSQIDKTMLVYAIPFIRKLWNNYFLKFLNKQFKKLWNKYRFPTSKPNGYVMIIEKIR